MAQPVVEAWREEGWRTSVLWRSLVANGVTRARAALAFVSVIFVDDCLGSGGRGVASPWTRWGGLGCAERLTVEQGGEGGGRVFLLLLPERCRGPGDHGIVSRRERGRRGTRLGVGVALSCAPQCCTISTGGGGGDVFDTMAARALLWPIDLIFGG